MSDWIPTLTGITGLTMIDIILWSEGWKYGLGFIGIVLIMITFPIISVMNEHDKRSKP